MLEAQRARLASVREAARLLDDTVLCTSIDCTVIWTICMGNIEYTHTQIKYVYIYIYIYIISSPNNVDIVYNNFRIDFVNESMLLRSNTKSPFVSIRGRFDQTSFFFMRGVIVPPSKLIVTNMFSPKACFY